MGLTGAGVGFAYRVDSAAVQDWIKSIIGASEFAKISSQTKSANFHDEDPLSGGSSSLNAWPLTTLT